MRIKITQDVSTSFNKTAKGGYSVAEVNYEGAKKPFKLFSFKNPAVFDALKDAKAGQVFEVNSVKGEDGFFSWTTAKEVAEDEAPTEKKSWTPGADPRETKEERALRQRLIVRQSSLKEAIEFHKLHAGSPPEQDILDTAERFTAWVYEAPDLFDEPNDIPF